MKHFDKKQRLFIADVIANLVSQVDGTGELLDKIIAPFVATMNKRQRKAFRNRVVDSYLNQ